MAKSTHTRDGKPRRHTNGTFGSHMNGKVIDRKKEHLRLKEASAQKGARRR